MSRELDYSAAEVAARIDAVIHKNRDRIAGGCQAHQTHTPLDSLIDAEGLDMDDRRLVEKVREETLHKMLDYFFADGPEPIQVVRRVYALVKTIRPDLIGDMSLEDISVLCADGGRATVQARIKRVYNDLIDKMDGARLKVRAPFQKSHTAREKYAEAQKGNCNRRGGKKAAKRRKTGRRSGGSSK